MRESSANLGFPKMNIRLFLNVTDIKRRMTYIERKLRWQYESIINLRQIMAYKVDFWPCFHLSYFLPNILTISVLSINPSQLRYKKFGLNCTMATFLGVEGVDIHPPTLSNLRFDFRGRLGDSKLSDHYWSTNDATPLPDHPNPSYLLQKVALVQMIQNLFSRTMIKTPRC